MKTRILLLFGGESSEHDVSLMSARNIHSALDTSKYDVKLGYISRTGNNWLLVKSFNDLNGPVILPILGQKSFKTHDAEVTFDLILPILHGIHGEDGDVQGLARLMHLPCVGPSLIGAAITMDKDVTKRLLRDAGIPVVDWTTWRTADPRPAYTETVARLGHEVFVKPANAGSSVGVSKVHNQAEWEMALDLAAQEDSLVLVERAVQAHEIEVAVLGNRVPEITQPGEIKPGEEHYSYSDKYGEDSSAQAYIPANLTPELTAEICKLALQAYSATRGHGMARVDFFIDPGNNIYLNEINSIPGFTNISMYPKLWQNSGLSCSVLLDRLISLATQK